MEFYITRFKNIEKVTYELEVITPMFLGGSDPRKAELRAPSIKGMLRFWWRAIYGKDFPSLNEMKDKEEQIFGSSEKKSNLKIFLKYNITSQKNNLPSGKKFEVLITNRKTGKKKKIYLGIIDYLAYGLYKYKKGEGNIYQREFFKPGDIFYITLKFHKDFTDEILNSFYTLINYGGLGSRSRNGFGSIFTKNVNKLNKNFNNDLLDFTSFSKYSKLFIFNEHTNWIDALSEIGLAYRKARLSLEPKHQFYNRALIAKPIEAKFEKIPKEIREGRHGKPYFLHVNKLPNWKYQAKILFLPYKYYKDGKIADYLNTCNNVNNILQRMSKGVLNVF